MKTKKVALHHRLDGVLLFYNLEEILAKRSITKKDITGPLFRQADQKRA